MISKLVRGIASILFSLVVLFLFVTMAVSTAHAETPLSDYIEATCKRNCVDSTLLMMAIQEAAIETDTNPLVLLAIIKEESGFNVRATNTKNGRSVGLTQIQVFWHKEKFKGDQYDVFANVRAGALVYKDCVKKHRGNREKSLWCYNGHQKNGYHYVSKVMKTYNKLIEKGIAI